MSIIGYIMVISGFIGLVFSEFIDKAVTGKSLIEAHVTDVSIHHAVLLTGIFFTILGSIIIILSLQKQYEQRKQTK